MLWFCLLQWRVRASSCLGIILPSSPLPFKMLTLSSNCTGFPLALIISNCLGHSDEEECAQKIILLSDRPDVACQLSYLPLTSNSNGNLEDSRMKWQWKLLKARHTSTCLQPSPPEAKAARPMAGSSKSAWATYWDSISKTKQTTTKQAQWLKSRKIMQIQGCLKHKNNPYIFYLGTLT